MHFRLVTISNSPRLYVEWRENGSKRRVSTGTSDRSEAESFLATFRLEYLDQQATEWPTIAACLEYYFGEHVGQKPSAQQAEIAIRFLKAFWGSTTVDGATPVRQKRYARERMDLGRSTETVNRELSVLSAAIRYAAKHGKLPGPPPIIQMLPAKDARERFLTRDEAARLLRHLHRGKRHRHLLIFARLALYTGARASAITGLTWNRVDLARGVIDYRDGPSTAKGRPVLPIDDGLVRMLKHTKAKAKTDHVIEWAGEPVGRIVRGFVRQAKDAGLPGVTPNTLRHTFGTWAAMSGQSMFLVARSMGHKRVSTTERYAKHETASLRAVMRSVRHKR